MVSPANYETLGLRAWPFHVVPDLEGPLMWADRVELLRQIRRLLRRLNSHQASTLHLLWADFGAGKTHTLLYLRQLALTDFHGKVFPVYTALPKASRSFVDIYRAIIRGVGFDRLVDRYASTRSQPAVHQHVRKMLGDATPGLPTVFEALRIGSDSIKQAAQRWLLADPSMTRQELTAASLPSRIRTTDEAVAVLAGVTRLLMAHGSSRILIMIDEFQRTGVLRRGFLDEINAGLHTYFNSCPQGLTLILSFSFGSASNMRHYLNQELQSRADPQVISIPSLDKDGAVTFLRDLLNEAKAPNEPLRIDDGVLSIIVDRLASSDLATPRNLIKIAGAVLSEAAMDIADGLIERVDGEYASKIIDNLGPLSDAGEEE